MGERERLQRELRALSASNRRLQVQITAEAQRTKLPGPDVLGRVRRAVSRRGPPDAARPAIRRAQRWARSVTTRRR